MNSPEIKELIEESAGGRALIQEVRRLGDKIEKLEFKIYMDSEKVAEGVNRVNNKKKY